jgi:hypothetical protein
MPLYTLPNNLPVIAITITLQLNGAVVMRNDHGYVAHPMVLRVATDEGSVVVQKQSEAAFFRQPLSQ